jgi:hypothetical protein
MMEVDDGLPVDHQYCAGALERQVRNNGVRVSQFLLESAKLDSVALLEKLNTSLQGLNTNRPRRT